MPYLVKKFDRKLGKESQSIVNESLDIILAAEKKRRQLEMENKGTSRIFIREIANMDGTIIKSKTQIDDICKPEVLF